MKKPINIYENEEWRKTPLLPDHFMVSNMGRCMNTNTNNILSGTISRGYKYISYSLNGYDKKTKLHRAVAAAFVDNPNPEVNTVINHIDGNKLNNSAENLEWTTSAENVRHAYRTGLNNEYNHDITKQVPCVAIDKNTQEVRGVAHSISKMASEMQRRNIEDKTVSQRTMCKLISDTILRDCKYKRLNNKYYRIDEIKDMKDEQAKLVIGPILESKGIIDY